jgi:hypothetical protein
MRPPLSQERLEWRPDGRLELTLKNVWKDGTRALVLEPFDLLARLCSAIPPPWFNMVSASCSLCGGPMRWLQAATRQSDITRLLAKHGLAPQPPPSRSQAPLCQLALAFG